MVKEISVEFSGYGGNIIRGRIFRPDYFGNYPGVVFCHGYRTDSREFMNFPAKLAERGYKVLTFDYSGNGKSDGIPTLFTRGSHMADTYGAISELKNDGCERIGIIGHSLGAHAALVALRDNKSIDCAVLVSPPRKSGDGLPWYLRPAFAIVGQVFDKFSLVGDRNIYITMKADYRNNYEDPNAVLEAKRVDYAPRKLNVGYLGYAISIDNEQVGKSVTKPVLVIASDKDRSIPIKSSVAVYNALSSRSKELCILTNSGHSPFADYDKDVLLDRIDKFAGKYLRNNI
ncbi:MAG: alpha/beta hydrolase [Candidatus Omnitrophica bacterium]|nr:alpha/beta hydrolase [Candidatus Omnitrophota bacterium]